MTQTGKHLLRQLIKEILDGFGTKSVGKDTGTNMRFDVPVIANTNLLNDEEYDDQEAKQDVLGAACCLVLDGDGKVLAVSRKDDPNAMGLPGGKIDDGEDAMTAAGRELKEETGLDAVELHPVFTRKEDDGFTTTTFATKISGKIHTREEGVVRWVDPQELFDGPFGAYNIALWKHLGLPR